MYYPKGSQKLQAKIEIIYFTIYIVATTNDKDGITVEL